MKLFLSSIVLVTLTVFAASSADNKSKVRVLKEAKGSKIPKSSKSAKSVKSAKSDKSAETGVKSDELSKAAGLQFPVGRVGRYLRDGKYATRMGAGAPVYLAGAPVYLAAVLGYLCAEILEMAGNIARDNQEKRIFPQHLTLASITMTKKSEEEVLSWDIKEVESYSTYIYKVLKQVHPDTGISKESVSMINSFIDYMFGLFVGEVEKVATSNKKDTISSKEFKIAVRLMLPGELAKGAVSEGAKAVEKFRSKETFS